MPLSSWSIRLARTIFLILAVLLGAAIPMGFKWSIWIVGLGALSGLIAGIAFILIDDVLARFSFREFSAGTFGLLIGLFCASLVTRVGFFDLPWFHNLEDAEAWKSIIEVCIYFSLGFFGITLALRSDRDQFSLIIPYVRFRRDASEGEPMLLDSNVIIDGRIPRIFATGFLSGIYIIPRFVVDELQRLADSRDLIKSARGKRGIDCMQEMRETKGMDITIHESSLRDGEAIDVCLASLARELNARLLTNDINLGKIAKLRNVTVLNFHDLTRAMQPEVCTGDEFELSLVKPGRDKHQAVGYLPDGAMIVVNHAAAFIGETVSIVVSSTLQTSAGRLIFAELKQNVATSATLGV
ncbi:PIN/TRAM domain-containing protein [soil metagenome]